MIQICVYITAGDAQVQAASTPLVGTILWFSLIVPLCKGNQMTKKKKIKETQKISKSAQAKHEYLQNIVLLPLKIKLHCSFIRHT